MLPNPISNNRFVLRGLLSMLSVMSFQAHAEDPAVSVQTLSVQRALIAQPVRGYGVVAAWAANLTTINVAYPARLTQIRVRAGEAVSKGDPLCVVQADPTAAIAAAQAVSAVSLAQGELARTRALFDKGLATRSQVATAAKAAEDAQQALAVQQKTGIVMGDKVIRAPADGVIIQVSAAQGDQLAAGAPILQLTTTDRVQDGAQKQTQSIRANVMLGVEPDQAARMRVGDGVDLKGVSVTSSASPSKGKVVSIGAAIDPQTQLVDVGVSAALAQSGLIPGSRVAADIGTEQGVHWIVPRLAVLRDEKGPYVFQLDGTNHAKRVAVSIAIESGDRYGVEGAIDGTKPIVVEGAYELQDGALARPQAGEKATTGTTQ